MSTTEIQYRILAGAVAGRCMGAFLTQEAAQAFYDETGGPLPFAAGLFGDHHPQVVEAFSQAFVRSLELTGFPIYADVKDSESCSNQAGHEWPKVEERERCLCIHCGADGDG